MNWSISEPGAKGAFRPWAALAALLAYGALWGCLSSLGSLSSLGLWALLPGGLLSAAAGGLPLGKWRNRLLLAGLCAALLLALLLGASALDGVKNYLNRLFSASEARQSYLYARFSSTGRLGNISRAMIPLGLLSGCWYGWCGVEARRGLSLVPGLLLLAAVSWLGAAPEPVMLAALLLSLLGALLLPQTGSPFLLRLLPLLLAGLLCLGSFLLFPKENPGLQSTADRLRDRLAPRTQAYGELPKEETPTETPPETRPYELEPHREEEDSSSVLSSKTLLTLAVILASLLALFVPALWKDRLRKRQAKNRAGLEDPDPKLRTKAAFLYAMRWLREAGLEPKNQPFSAYLEALSSDSQLSAAFQQVLPIWQEAAYSPHPGSEAGAEQMAEFVKLCRARSLAGMNRRQRLRIQYITAL